VFSFPKFFGFKDYRKFRQILIDSRRFCRWRRFLFLTPSLIYFMHDFKEAKADESAARSGRSMLFLFPLYFLVKRSGLVYLKNQQADIKNPCLVLR
jgi:hypothetical protein